jgi:DNA-binding transcriptional ArsR family regulator
LAEADVFEAIANPTRRLLLDRLRDGPRPVRSIAAGLAMSRPAVSQHLRVLREAHLVREEKIGRERHYRLDAAPLAAVDDWIATYERFWHHRLTALRRLLDEEG